MRRWRRKLLRETVLFRDADGKLLPPLPDDVIVAGSIQHRAFQDAGIAVDAVHPTVLLDEGYQNDWLVELAPGYKPKPPKPEPVKTEASSPGESAPMPPVAQAPPGKASARYDSENVGYGKPPPGGRRVQL